MTPYKLLTALTWSWLWPNWYRSTLPWRGCDCQLPTGRFHHAVL